MIIEARVVGVRLWPRTKGQRRVVSLEWAEEPSEDNPFPIHFSIDIDDPTKQFDLGDNVQIELSLLAQQDRALSIQ
jgi:hypothetical protein